jgi:hypothetical protein
MNKAVSHRDNILPVNQLDEGEREHTIGIKILETASWAASSMW